MVVDAGNTVSIIPFLRNCPEVQLRKIAFLPGLLILWLCAACGSCDRAGSGLPAPSFGPTEGVPIIRVALRTDADSLPIAIEGPYTIKNGENSKLFSQGSSLPKTNVVFRDPFFIVVEPSRMKTNHLILIPKNDGTLVVGDRHYRGVLHLLNRDGKIAAVNHVNIEHYLASVVPSEMKMSWPEAALKAQAVAARTYALWRMEQAEKRDLDWDVTSGSASQVYGGLDKESRKSRQVVVDTAGTVLTYEGKIFPTYYHSTCGGFTADAHVVFGGKEMSCLMGVP
jgi:stage II sporulation protein D